MAYVTGLGCLTRDSHSAACAPTQAEPSHQRASEPAQPFSSACTPAPSAALPAPAPAQHTAPAPAPVPRPRTTEMPKESTKATKRRAAEKQEKAPKSKGKKDPKAPKRALSAYMFFSQDWRERIKAENPDAGFGEIGKLLGAKWKELDDEEKKPYLDQAAADKARAEQQKSEYDGKKADSGSGDGDDDDE